MNKPQRPPAIDKLRSVSHFNTVLGALNRQGYQESRSRLEYEENRTHLLNLYRLHQRTQDKVRLYPLPPD